MIKAENALNQYKWTLNSMRGDCNENMDKLKKDLETLQVGF